ncbi:MAG: 2-haloacrylate reductase [Alphaproteobacteria bacterium MarineAlpha3_Bin7]|nr:MAG: 2-haloacrylate reductase [Alphaproteobacteria bacterium MarineAlpha3_Bin7]
MANTMKAACYKQLGGPEVLEILDLEIPEPGPGEVRVKVNVSGVNPSDWKARRNGRGGGMGFDMIIPHSDGSGTVDAVGDGVESPLIGEKVWTVNAQYKRPFGTAAEYVVVPRNYVFKLPKSTSLEEAACFGIPFLTAYRALTVDGDISGQNILIQGGAGSVGHHLIQIAKWLGAKVLTSVSSEEKERYVIDAGADEVFNYRDSKFVENILSSTNGVGVDRIIEVDVASNIKTYDQILKPKGAAIIYGTSLPVAEAPSYSFIVREAKLQWILVYELNDEQREQGVSLLNDMVVSGKLKTTISQKFSLEEVAEAHKTVEDAQHIGNVILEI